MCPLSARSQRRAAQRLACSLTVLLASTVLSLAQAHGSLVLGAVSLSPDPPVPGEALTISVVLATSGNAPVEGAKLAGELTATAAAEADAASTGTSTTTGTPTTMVPAIPVPLREFPEPYGTYRARITAPAAGRYTLKVVDHTYPKESTSASVVLQVGGPAANGALDFTFPPTNVPRSLVSWLLWLVGLPLAAGIVVTVLMMRSKRGEGTAPPS